MFKNARNCSKKDEEAQSHQITFPQLHHCLQLMIMCMGYPKSFWNASFWAPEQWQSIKTFWKKKSFSAEISPPSFFCNQTMSVNQNDPKFR